MWDLLFVPYSELLLCRGLHILGEDKHGDMFMASPSISFRLFVCFDCVWFSILVQVLNINYLVTFSFRQKFHIVCGVLKFHLLSTFCVLQTEENTERKIRTWILRGVRELFKKQALNLPGCIQA